MKGDIYSGLSLENGRGVRFSANEVAFITENIKRILSTRRGERVNEFEQNDTPSRLSDSYGDSFSVCAIFDNQLSYGILLCVPYPAARVHYDDGRSSQRMRKRPQSRCEYRFDPCGGVLHVYYAGLLYTVDHSKQRTADRTGGKSVRNGQVRAYLQLRSARLRYNGTFHFLHGACDEA